MGTPKMYSGSYDVAGDSEKEHVYSAIESAEK